MPNSSAHAAREVDRIVDPAFESGNVAGHRARRLIDGKDVEASDPFILMAEDYMPRDAFSRHPHRGMETVTLVLDGTIEHFDSAGHRGILKTGDAQWMTAGRGVTHEENAIAGSVARTLQLWVNLPTAEKMSAPRYQDLRGDDLPVRREEGVEIRVMSGRSGDAVSSTLNHVAVTAIDARLDPGASFGQTLDAHVNAFVLVLEGEAMIGTRATFVGDGALAWLTRDEDEDGSQVMISGGPGGARVLLFAGRPLREPIAFGGPFVMNTQAEIVEAFADYRAGRF